MLSTSTITHAPDDLRLAAKQALLEACQDALAWVDAAERDDGSVDLDRLYFQWRDRMRAAFAQAAAELP